MQSERCENKKGDVGPSSVYSPKGEISVSLHSDGALNVRQKWHFITPLTSENENNVQCL